MLRDARPLRLCAAVLAAVLLVATSARAEPGERVALRWTAPASCPTDAAVRAEIDRLLGPGAARPPAPIPVTAEVSQDDQGAWRVHLETSGEGAPRVREIHGASCAAIADATALILALMIDPAAALAAPSATRSPEGATRSPEGATRSPEGATRSPEGATRSPAGATRSPAGATRSPEVPSRSPVPAPEPVPISFRASASAGLDLGSLPQITATLALRGAVVLGAQRIELGAAFLPARAGTVAARPTTGGDVDLLVGSVGTCRHFGAAPLQIAPCVGFELGRLHAAGFGVTDPGSGSALWAAFEGGGEISYRLFAHAALALRLGAVVPLSRPRFVLDNVGEVFRPPPVAGRGSLGIDYIF